MGKMPTPQMTNFEPRQSRQPSLRQRSILAVVMLLVFIGSLGAAWWLVQERSTPVENAIRLLAQVKSEGLDKFLHADAQPRYYVLRDAAGNPIGGMRQAVELDGDTFQGAQRLRSVEENNDKTWTINKDLSQGFYEGTVKSMLAKVQQDQDGLKVAWFQGPVPRAGALEPNLSPSYLPQGLEDTMAFLVSRQNEVATFRTIDLEAIDTKTGQVTMSSLRMTPLGNGRVRLQLRTMEGNADATYKFDDQGVLQEAQYETKSGTHSLALTDVKKMYELAGKYPILGQLLPAVRRIRVRPNTVPAD